MGVDKINCEECVMRKAKILIIEDEKDIIELVQYNLEREGYTVMAVDQGEEALNTAKNCTGFDYP